MSMISESDMMKSPTSPCMMLEKMEQSPTVSFKGVKSIIQNQKTGKKQVSSVSFKIDTREFEIYTDNNNNIDVRIEQMIKIKSPHILGT